MTSHGFIEVKRMTFVRKAGEAQEIIALALRKTRDHQHCLSVGVGLRFESIEQKIKRSPLQELFFTVGLPLHLLTSSRHFKEWCFSQEIPEGMRKEIEREIETLAFPFLEKFRKLEAVEESLLDDDPRRWFTLSARERMDILEAFKAIRGLR